MTDEPRKTDGAPPPTQGATLVVRPPMPPVIAEFQTDAVELEEKDPPRIARMTLFGITALISAAVIWATVSEIDEVVVATGKLITTKPTIVVQPLETSIIRTIDVTAGEIVRAGQTLATFDSTFSQADVDQQRAKFGALDAQVKRIEAELSETDYLQLAGDTPDEKLQGQLFSQRKAYRAAQIQNYDQQIAGQIATMASSKNQQEILVNRRDNLAEIEKARELLWVKQSGSRMSFLGSRDARFDVDTRLAELRGRVEEAVHTLGKLRADREAFIEDFRRAAMEQLADLRNQRDLAGNELRKMELRRNMVVLAAPADAVVLDLAKRSVGSVVTEAEPIVTLVPLDVPLEAEVSINSRDIGRIAVDKEVRVKFDAYPFQKFGTASGTVRTISRDAFSPTQEDAASGQPPVPYFKARVHLVDTRLKTGSDAVVLLPGMAVTAEIKVGRRTVMSYFLYPLMRGLDTAIREP